LTLCLDSDGLGRLKQPLQAFRRGPIDFAETQAAPSRVVQLNLQLFPLTRDIASNLPPSVHPAPGDSP